MNDHQFERLLKILKEFVVAEEPVAYSGISLAILLDEFGPRLAAEGDLDAVLARWEDGIANLSDQLLADARERGKVFEIEGQEFVLISEESGSLAVEICPKGP